MIPRLDSVCPMRAVSLRIRRWHAIAISQPPPRAWPLSAATTGFAKRSIRRSTRLPKRMNSDTSPPENAEPRSAPAQKMRSPAPVMTTARTASSAAISVNAASSSRMSDSLMALAGGRFRVMTAMAPSRASSKVSYGIAPGSSAARLRGHAAQEDVGDRLRGVDEPVGALAQHPGGCHLVHRAEQRLGRDLDRHVGAELSPRHALVDHRGDQREVRRDLLRRGAAEELLTLAELDLQDLGQLGIVLEHLEVQAHEAAQLGDRVGLVRDRLAQRADEVGHLVAEERDEDVVLGLEVQIDGAGGHPRLPRDVRHARVVVALAREDADGGFDDLVGLLRIAHGE